MEQPKLGQKIVELRRKKGLTQEELVVKCKLNVRTLQRIESGEANPRSYTIRSIFKALEYDENDDWLKEKSHPIKIYFENSVKRLYEQRQTFNSMKNSKTFFYNYFLSVGIIWFFCALSIVLFELSFQVKEILLTIILPLGFAIFRQFGKSDESSQPD